MVFATHDEAVARRLADHRLDLPADRAHPKKRLRPFAAGTARGDKAVEGQGPFGHISAQGFEILDKGGRIVFSGKARLELRPQAMKAAKK